MKKYIKTIYLISIIYLFFPLSVSSINLDGEINVYSQYRETTGSDRLIPIYQYLNLDVNDIYSKYVSFHFGGWLRESLNNQDINGRRINNELQYTYVSFRNKKSNATLNAGRIFAYEGTVSEQIDGIYGRTDLIGGFGIATFGGIPVETDFDGRTNDLIYGGRITHEIANIYTIGFTYLDEKNDNSGFRKEEGIDFIINPLENLDISGKSIFNAIKNGWMEHNAYISILPLNNIRVNTEILWLNYNNYFQSSTMNAFNVQTGVIDSNERLLSMGASIEYSLLDNFIISPDYKNYNYISGAYADYYGAKISYYSEEINGGVAFHKMDGRISKLKYNEYRIYGYKKIAGIDVTIDASDILYNEEINDVKDAYSISLALGYNIIEDLKIYANTEYSRNPNFDRDVRFFVRTQYTFGIGKKEDN